MSQLYNARNRSADCYWVIGTSAIALPLEATLVRSLGKWRWSGASSNHRSTMVRSS